MSEAPQVVPSSPSPPQPRSRKASISRLLAVTAFLFALLDLWGAWQDKGGSDMIQGPTMLEVPLALTAIVLAGLALHDIAEEQSRGRGAAIAALVLSAISLLAIPAAIRVQAYSRHRGWEGRGQSEAVGSVRMINAAEATYASAYPALGFSPDLAALGCAGQPPGPAHACLLDDALASGNKRGYRFTYSARDTNADGIRDAYSVHSDPVNPKFLHFYSDGSGTIRRESNHPASASSSALQ